MTQVLVTGGTGYLGRHLVGKLLAAGRKVRILARPASDVSGLDGAEIVRGDVTDAGAVGRALAGVSRVFHLAAETRDGQPAEVYDRVNHRAVTALLEAASACGVERFLHTSHYYAIGRSGEPRSPRDFVNDEYWTHDPGDMHGPHEESQCDAENSVNQRVSLGEPVLALIPTMMYGPEARPISGVAGLAAGNRIVRLLAEHAAGRYAGMPGDGQQVWNLVHVADVAQAHLAVMDAEDPTGAWPPRAFTHWHYLCAGENLRLSELFARFGRLAGVAPPGRAAPPRRGFLARVLGGGGDPAAAERYALDSRDWAFSAGLATSEWGYRSRGLDQGLEETVAWMRRSGLLK